MKKILLNTVDSTSKNYKKYSALIDDEDFELVNKYKWSVKTDRSGYVFTAYTRTNNIPRKIIYMHNLIMNKLNIGHIDDNGLNNQKYNLQVRTKEQSRWSQIKRSKTKFIYKGVGITKYITKKGITIRYPAAIQCKGKDYFIGNFKTPEDAAKAYNEKALELFGEFAHLNEIN